MNKPEVKIIGAGLAGCEAAYQLSKRGFKVSLYEMKPAKKSPAHKSDNFAELVCSNSLRSDRIQNGAGLLKEELRLLDSLVIRAADATRIPAGGALAVDRDGFSEYITRAINEDENITVIEGEVEAVPEGPVIIATGPLTDGKLLEAVNALTGEPLHFYDAAAPIVTKESLDMDKVFVASRYERGSDYLNCPMTRDEYFRFVRELTSAQTAPLHSFEKVNVFEGCMPVEIMAGRGDMTLAFGPLKPIGLCDERTGVRPFAVVQLRRDNADGTLYNIVGFQTNLKFGEQKRVFSLIPGLENAEFVRYGVMHRNSFLNAPGRLDSNYRLIGDNHSVTYFAGQITGVEGYVESISSGYVAGVSLARELSGLAAVDFTSRTATGALAHYISDYVGSSFQPQNINFGIMEAYNLKIRNKQERYTAIAERALETVRNLKSEYEL